MKTSFKNELYLISFLYDIDKKYINVNSTALPINKTWSTFMCTFSPSFPPTKTVPGINQNQSSKPNPYLVISIKHVPKKNPLQIRLSHQQCPSWSCSSLSMANDNDNPSRRRRRRIKTSAQVTSPKPAFSLSMTHFSHSTARFMHLQHPITYPHIVVVVVAVVRT